MFARADVLLLFSSRPAALSVVTAALQLLLCKRLCVWCAFESWIILNANLLQERVVLFRQLLCIIRVL
jgi:hypothetical protein